MTHAPSSTTIGRDLEIPPPVPTAAAELAAAAAPFLDQFRAKHGRAPRILHIGNIANNAYLNAKLLNEAGYDCDVLCYDYYHLMGCPEWEDADFDGAIDDQFRPDWTAVDLRGFSRPRWFAQGPQGLSISYLLAKRSGDTAKAERLWQELARQNKTAPPSSDFSAFRTLGDMATRLRWKLRIAFDRVRGRSDAQELAWSKLDVWASRRGTWGWLVVSFAAPFLYLGISAAQLLCIAIEPKPFNRVWSRLERRAQDGGGFLIAALFAPVLIGLMIVLRGLANVSGLVTPSGPATASGPASNADPRAVTATDWIEVFKGVYPERRDELTATDLGPYQGMLSEWSRLMAHYDIVQAYATDVVYPLLGRKRPYIGFEHGTLRDFTLNDNAISRLTALGYQQADHVFITNGDCLSYAQRIKVSSYTAMIHPVDDDRIRSVKGDYDALHREFNAKYLFVCPLRHDWSVKGTDQYIRALPGIVATVGSDVRVVMTRWGAQLDDSYRLARQLGVDKYIAWVEPLNRGKLVRLQKSADIVFDQIALPHFGATAPQAIAAGVPVIMSYDPASTAWIIPEPAPILTAWTSDEIVRAVETGLDPGWRDEYALRSARWFDAYHSSRQAVRRATEVYRDVCVKNEIL